jgi:hypothetical protein
VDETTALEKIRKLLAKAEDGSVTPQEAESFRDGAFALAARFRIDHAKLIASGDAPNEKIANRIITVGKPFTQIIQLANEIFLSNDCTVIKIATDRFHAFGYENDMAKSEILFTSVLLQAERWVRIDFRDHGGSERRPTFRRGWYAAFAGRIARRLKEINKKEENEEATTPGATLVLRSRMAGAEGEANNFYPDVRTRKAQNRFTSGAGINAGKTRGDQADLGQERLGGTHQELEG